MLFCTRDIFHLDFYIFKFCAYHIFPSIYLYNQHLRKISKQSIRLTIIASNKRKDKGCNSQFPENVKCKSE